MESIAIKLEKCPDEYRDIVSNVPDGTKGEDIVLLGYSYYEKEIKRKFNSSQQRKLNGLVFELLIIDALHSVGIKPIGYQATLAYVPNVKFDIVLYDEKSPFVISCKTSLRERWKQAELEAEALKRVYRRGKSVLVTLSEQEGYNVQEKISSGDVNGLDQCIVVQKGKGRFNKLLSQLTKIKFKKSEPINPIKAKFFP